MKRKLTASEKRYAIEAKRAEIRDSGQAAIIPDLVVDDEADAEGRAVVRDKTNGLAQ